MAQFMKLHSIKRCSIDRYFTSQQPIKQRAAKLQSTKLHFSEQ